MQKQLKNVTIFLLLVLMVVSLYMISADTEPQARELSYMGEFRPMVVSGQVASVEVRPQGNDTTIYTGKLKNGSEFYTQGPADEGISEFFEENGVTDVHYNGVPEPNFWTQLLLSLLPILLIGAFLFFMLNQGQGGGKVMQFGKSRARLHLDEKKRTTFKDVAGIDEVIEELSEVVDFLKTPKKYNQLGARIPKGVLLYGSPGTGKTLLAKAVAGEAGVPFFTISGSDFVEMFVGVGASRVRDLFVQGKKNAPCLIFIDEIDAVGRQRGAGLGGGHDEREQTLNQLLVEMDGFESNEGVILIAATNRPDVLDPALLRPGRFDRQVVVPTPDLRGRVRILQVHTKKTPLDEGVDLDVLARGTPGFSGADLENLVNEAALQAAKLNQDRLDMRDFEFAKDKVLMGRERRSLILSDDEKRITAYHEGGHALAARLLPGSDPVHKVTIIPRGRALGVTMQLPEEDRHGYSRNYLRNNLVVLLGGRVAEELVLDDITTGASNDIERVTRMARKMVCEWGMSESIGTLSIGETGEEVFIGREWVQNKNFSEETARLVDAEVKRIVEEAHTRCRKLLEENADALHRIANALLERETITGDDLDLLMDDKPLPPLEVGGNEKQPVPEAAVDGDSDFELEEDDEDKDSENMADSGQAQKNNKSSSADDKTKDKDGQ